MDILIYQLFLFTVLFHEEKYNYRVSARSENSESPQNILESLHYVIMKTLIF